MTDAEAVEQFEQFVWIQKPAEQPWEPVTPFDFESRKAIEGIHPQLIKDVFLPKRVLDVGCGPGHLVRLLRELDVPTIGVDKSVTAKDASWGSEGSPVMHLDVTKHTGQYPLAELVICREVIEHLTVKEIAVAVRNLVGLSSRFIYVTTRFCQHPSHLLSVDEHDDLDPTHITMLTKPFLRTLFVLEGCKSRPDLEAKMDWQHKGRCLVMEVPQ